jgi:general stress protein 26
MSEAKTMELADPDVQRLLNKAPLARLAYVAGDGYPTVVPVGFLWKDGAVVVCTATTAAKVKAIGRSPRVALEIEGGQGAEQVLLIKGDAQIDIVDGVADEYLAMSRRTMSADDAEQFEAQVRSTYPQMARITITPAWVRYYDFAAGRLPPFLAALIEEAGNS